MALLSESTTVVDVGIQGSLDFGTWQALHLDNVPFNYRRP